MNFWYYLTYKKLVANYLHCRWCSHLWRSPFSVLCLMWALYCPALQAFRADWYENFMAQYCFTEVWPFSITNCKPSAPAVKIMRNISSSAITGDVHSLEEWEVMQQITFFMLLTRWLKHICKLWCLRIIPSLTAGSKMWLVMEDY